jgi:hypothetical protein
MVAEDLEQSDFSIFVPEMLVAAAEGNTLLQIKGN